MIGWATCWDECDDAAHRLALRDWDTAEPLLRENAGSIQPNGGVLHLMAKRNDSDVIGWAEFFQQPEIARILRAH